MPRRFPAASDDAGALQAYLRAIARLPRLTGEEERTLAQQIQERGDEEALRRLVEANLRFVVSYAKRYRGLGVPFLDLIHEGNLGLIEAARRFRSERNVKFITYAVWWVRQAILQALSVQMRAFSVPAKLSGAAARFGRNVAALTSQLERAPTLEEIAVELDMTEAQAEEFRRLGRHPVSLQEPVGGDEEDGRELGETLAQTMDPPVEVAMLRRTLEERFGSLLAELEVKEREVMRLRFGLDGDEPRTLQEIGDRLRLSRERIRQIESRAKEKLRRSRTARELRSCLN